MLINEKAGEVTKADYPDSWRQGELKFRVTYQFEPGADADGVTVHVPLQVLNQVTDEGFDWQIPGLREELVTELIRSLPKPIRRNYVPAPNFAKRFLDRAVPLQEPLTATMARELKRMVGVPFEADDFDWSKVPDHSEGHLPDRRRTAPQAGRGQGPGGAEAPAAAEGAQGPLPGGRGDGRALRRRVPGALGSDATGRSARSPVSSRPAGPVSR